ncbi:hypothetical protein HELRODRAFT_85962 [Helobdella robusta]|uniref:Cyclin-like domain-containing protein n=1 Tax=Helobdella robusta TaxID=6412 RepID=T1G650_HELRO|nr:hypothetical protein HELRODRAFT_85962 [Helobdella robusta]ESN96842.1 hypothetical protein HELRODRAFT_85962 [Helobdella robusta]
MIIIIKLWEPFQFQIYLTPITLTKFSKVSKLNEPCTEQEWECRENFRQNILSDNEELSARSRSILVDWIIQVASHLQLLPETLELSVSMIDRYVAREAIPLSKFQLLGIVAVLVACKYEERSAPEVRDLTYLTENLYTFDQVINFEVQLLRTLHFQAGSQSYKINTTALINEVKVKVKLMLL